MLKPIVTVSDASAGQSTATASYPSGLQTNPYAISLEINKSASTPILSSAADLSASIADGNDSGISITLPTKSADSSDDLLTYELSGVPDWLNPTKGTVIEVSEVNGVATSTYQFEATDLAGLKWTAARSFNSANLTAEMQWRAIHTESSNFEQKSSTAVKIAISKTPVAVEPEVLGPGSFLIDEAGFIELKEYSVEVPGFSDTVANSSVLVDVNLGTGTKLTYLQVPSSPSSLLTINAGISASPEASLTLAQLQTAKISAIDPNYYGYTTDSGPRGSGPLSFSLAAKQTLGSSIAQSVATKAVSISIENIPEDVSLAAVDVIPTSENVNEGAVYALPKFVLNGTASGEDAYISLGVNSEFIVREINGLQKIELPIFYEAQHATHYESFYDLNLAKLSLGKYELLIPSGATTGAHTINLYAQSFDPATGAAGKEDLETFTINVRPTADTPVLIIPSEYELSEDELQDLYFGVTAFSPDVRESVEVQVTMIGPDGQPAPNFMIYASDVNYSAILNAQGTTVGIKYELDPDQLDPTYISVTAPVDFYNADATGQFIENSAKIVQSYSVQISTTSIYQDGTTAILSAPVTRTTAFIVRAVNDAPSITSGTFAGALNETSTLAATGSFSFSDVDLLDRPTAQFEFIGASGVQSDEQSPFALTDGQLAVIAAGFSLPSSTSTANQGIFSWQYARSSSQLDFLGKDDELTALFRVSVDDGFGGSDAQIVTLTITGTNDYPVITSEILTRELSELTTAATGNIVTTGDINFTDLDFTDVHTLVNNGNGIDVSSESALGSLKATLLSDTTGTGVGGKVRWTYTVPASAVEYLATGETKVEQFEITFTDNEGFSINKTIRLTLTGTNDVPTIIASDVAGQITEGAILSEQGSFLFNDVDLTDRATASTLSSSITALKANGATPLVLSDVQKLAIENAFSMSAGPSNTNNGSVAWRYAITEESLNFLAQGERVNAVFTVQVNDGKGGLVNQAVTLTITGTNDAPKIVTTGGIASGSVAEKADLSLGENTQTHAIAGRFDLIELDLSDIGGAIPMVVTAPPLGANYVGVLTPAISSTLSASGQGEVSWSFRVNDSEIDFLAHGQTLKQEYRLTVTDGAGATDTQVLTITITGSNDAPIIQSTLNLNLVEPSVSETLTQTLPVTFQDVDLTNTHQVSVSNVRVSGVDRSASVQFSSIEATGNVSNLSTTINAVLPQSTSITASEITQGVSATPKIFTTSFNALNKGDALTISGLTFVASRDISALEATNAFSGLAAGAVLGLGTSYGGYLGVLSGFTSNQSTTNTIAFSSTTPGINTPQFNPSLVAATISSTSIATPTVVQGQVAALATNEITQLTFSNLTVGESINLGGLTIVAGASGITANDLATFLTTPRTTLTNTGVLPADALVAGSVANVTFSSTGESNSVLATSTLTGNVTDLVNVGSGVVNLTITQGKAAIAAVTETATQTFVALHAGDSLAVGGLSFTATRGTTASETANAFAGLTAGATTGAGTAYGTYANQLTGFNTAATSGTNLNAVVFTSTVNGSNVVDLPVILNPALPPAVAVAPTAVIIPGDANTAETATLNFKALNRGDTLTVNGLRFTAARDLSASETAKAFEGLQSNATTGAGSGYGTYSNTLSGFSSGLADGIATVTDATLLSWISTQITKASNSSFGTMPITFNAPVGSFDYLAQGEEVVLSYRITLTDVAGQSSSKDLTIKVVGTNDIPRIATTSTGTSLDPSLAVTETSAPEIAIQSIPLVHGVMLDADNNAIMNVLATASTLPSIQSVTLNGQAFAADIPLIEVVAVGGSPTTNPLIWLQDNELKINAGDARFQALAKNDQLVFDIRYRVQDQFGAISAPIRAQVVVNGSDDLPIISAVDSVLSASFTEIQDNQSPRTESTELTFTAVRGGDRVTVSGLSFTAARDLTGAEVASAFSGLAAGETGKANITYGLYSGSLSAFTSGGVSDSKVVFASTTPNSDVTNLASAITLRTTPVVNLPTKTIVDGVVGSAETANLIFKEMLAGDSLSVGGLRFTADRNLLATEVRDAFLGLSAGATTGAGGNYGVYSGALTGFSSANTASAS